ncbi:hypothetical protein A2454_06195 [Candidatus Peribacteria bacterium RIFOXYC2_FULL_55_14]|nr:MAG: hypothetical protein UY85_C0001G0009 [Candidatus Peribacteria bacterium GW2011_GWB1_54_5]OGJ71902.1 MAG: hypothetical protein A2198_03370 [Candidatus Peribacteria bacterium RIFOXYA1_FULL_56_14]OGJ72752.1 MAG: hypothetical protein A2217_04690 [Candidatus Peribacteria bacterium RIFOXYA2_FULL_55_28]OGJ75343.1 MAG: hypothetical protein A2384_00365 [Candidatus Peribacteria bacterium RIFOXYB1_FULL_54_35]OGJ76480.1 MAG: hypothetical protein A2327_01505 [Candidatus Peribacteria bacterium RIFOXY
MDELSRADGIEDVDNVRILHISSNPIVLKEVGSLLLSSGFLSYAVQRDDVPMEQIILLKPDLILFDIDYPSSLSIVEEILSREPNIPLIIISSLQKGNELLTVKALKMGVSIYVQPKAIQDTLIRAVKSMLSLQGWENDAPSISVLTEESEPLLIGDETDEGLLVKNVSIPWFALSKELRRNPEFLFKIPWRRLEELVAGAYVGDGWARVVLTPRSGDKGRDVIVSGSPGGDTIQIVDQVKAYAKGNNVSADEVRALIGVLHPDNNSSKGFVTTTSSFAPGVYSDKIIQSFVPNRLELIDGEKLRACLSKINRKKKGNEGRS